MSTENENREFEYEGKKYNLIMPNADHIRKSDWFYSKTYNDALVGGISTHAEVIDILKRRGIVGEGYDKRLEELNESLGEKVVTMELESDKDARRKLALEVVIIRQDIFDWHQRVNAPLAHTCEQLADNEKVDYLTSCMTQSGDKALWDSFEAYKSEENRVLALEARMQVMLFMQGLDQDVFRNSPENTVLRTLAEEEEAELQKNVEAEAKPAPEAKEVPKKPVRKRRAKKAPAASKTEVKE